MMKILHLINTLSAGGAELHLLTLCKRQKSKNIELIVACLREQVTGSRSLRTVFEKENIRVVDLRADHRYNFGFIARLISLIRNTQPDVLHSHLPRADIAAAICSRFVKVPVFICSVHGIYSSRWFGTWAAPLMTRAYKRANGLIAISSAVKKWLEKGLGISGEKINVIYYGIEAEQFSLVDNGKVADGMIVGSIGRLEPGKGFECLIHAVQSIRRQIPHVSLEIVGHDPSGYGQVLHSLITDLGLSAHVKILGFQEDIAGFLKKVAVFAFASRSEGFGQVVIEAMASGKPVVASGIAPLSEIVRDGETGVLVNPDDTEAFSSAIVSLLNNRERAQMMGRQGQLRVCRYFSADRMETETGSLYESFLECSSCATR
jgi:glycosyltransferase involved in cell wall biosynthesis